MVTPFNIVVLVQMSSSIITGYRFEVIFHENLLYICQLHQFYDYL